MNRGDTLSSFPVLLYSVRRVAGSRAPESILARASRGPLEVSTDSATTIGACLALNCMFQLAPSRFIHPE